jgi:hypothetical protein
MFIAYMLCHPPPQRLLSATANSEMYFSFTHSSLMLLLSSTFWSNDHTVHLKYLSHVELSIDTIWRTCNFYVPNFFLYRLKRSINNYESKKWFDYIYGPL